MRLVRFSIKAAIAFHYYIYALVETAHHHCYPFPFFPQTLSVHSSIQSQWSISFFSEPMQSTSFTTSHTDMKTKPTTAHLLVMQLRLGPTQHLILEEKCGVRLKNQRFVFKTSNKLRSWQSLDGTIKINLMFLKTVWGPTFAKHVLIYFPCDNYFQVNVTFLSNYRTKKTNWTFAELGTARREHT